jgi:hypothetical protein
MIPKPGRPRSSSEGPKPFVGSALPAHLTTLLSAHILYSSHRSHTKGAHHDRRHRDPDDAEGPKGFFGYEKLTDFSKDWKSLDEADRKAVRDGIENGSMTY